MKLLPTLVLVTALGFGAAGAATAYHLAAPDQPAATARTAVVVPDTARPQAVRAPRPATVFRWAACPKGTVQHGKTCVRTVIHQVARSIPVQASSPAPAPPPAAAPAASHSAPHPASHPATHDDDQTGGQHEHEHEDGGDDGGGDDGPEHEDD